MLLPRTRVLEGDSESAEGGKEDEKWAERERARARRAEREKQGGLAKFCDLSPSLFFASRSFFLFETRKHVQETTIIKICGC